MKVSEFAKAINITNAAAYDLLRKDEYKKYVTTINGIKDVSNEILNLFNTYHIEKNNKIKYNGNQDQEEISILKSEITRLQQDIKEKDKQIIDFANRFAELAQQAQVLAGQAQVLQAAYKKELPPPEPEPEKKKSFFRKLWG